MCGLVNASSSSANVIAYNDADGVFVASGNDNSILQNSIHGNTSLGIDLGAGANMNQSAPVLTSVNSVVRGIQVSGSLTSTPNTTFTIEFFADDANEPSGLVYLGSVTVRTNASGVATYTFNGPTLPAGATYITATATNPTNNTSEFSNVVS